MEALLSEPLLFKALDGFGRQGVAEIVSAIQTLPVTRFGPVNASGKLAESVRYELDETPQGARLTFYAASYALTAVFGRKPGKFPPVARILQWMDDKPITVELTRRKDGTARQVRTGLKGQTRERTLLDEKKTAAFLIARSIAQKGTLLHQAGKPSQLLAGLTGAEATARLQALLLPGIVRTVTDALQQAA